LKSERLTERKIEEERKKMIATAAQGYSYMCRGKKMESITIKVDNIVGAVRRLTRLFVFTCQKTFSFFFIFTFSRSVAILIIILYDTYCHVCVHLPLMEIMTGVSSVCVCMCVWVGV
jgi:hypothetical protein